MKTLALVLLWSLAFCWSAGARPPGNKIQQSDADSAKSVATAQPLVPIEPLVPKLSLVLGNESNGVDGLFGPLTYGLEGAYPLSSIVGLEATFVRMHEPGLSTFNSFLDEARLALSLHRPFPLPFSSSRTAGSGSVVAWRNRMVDMYTTMAGLEVMMDAGWIRITAGPFLGVASEAGVSRFSTAMHVNLAFVYHCLTLSLDDFAGGSVQEPTISKYAAELSVDVPSLPLNLSLATERRYFDFGNGGPTIDPSDMYIYVLGAGIDLLAIMK